MPTVLVVDDSREDRKPLEKLLQSHGYDVITAADAYGAMSSAKRQTPDLILLDVMIPPMDGLTFLMLLRQETNGHEIPVIVLTGLDNQNTFSRARELGVKAVLIKGEFQTNYLLELVDQYVRRTPHASEAAGSV